jgi:hypothetical protein
LRQKVASAVLLAESWFEARRAGRVKRPWVLLGVLAVLIVAGAVLAGPSGSADRGPHGTLALRRYLEAMGGALSR